MPTITELHQRVYAFLCGSHPNRRPWHAQWLSTVGLYRELRGVLGKLEGRVLDIGCGSKPYGPWLTRATQHVGIDIRPGPQVDHVVAGDVDWPFPDGSFQAVISTQMLQHVADLPNFIRRVDRVLAPNETVVITFPFCYNDVSASFDSVQIRDYWRFTLEGARRLFPDNYEVVAVKPLGGIGSTLVILWSNWITDMATRSRITEYAFFALMPAWIVFCAIANGLGYLLDALDRTDGIYHDALLVLRKRPV